jgi:hypothetical protein
MMTQSACDEDRPPRWRSSIAAFRYDPADDYQPYNDAVISYVKFVVTIGPYQPEELSVASPGGFVPPELIDKVEETYPCYGALLQASVSPTKDDETKYDLNHYPYFIECEPKKREIYEQVSDTGEVLIGSVGSTSIGKSATDTFSGQNYNLDMGGSGSFGLGWGLISGGGGQSGQTGTVSGITTQTSDVTTTDTSTERRETMSHATQLTQMYNLLQSFHLGTNRVIFLIEPRPHVRQVDSTFYSGPREIEGVQEFLLIVVRPKAMKDFCLGALLETAHITYSSDNAIPVKTVTVPWKDHYGFTPDPQDHPMMEVREESFGFTPEDGWEIDTTAQPVYTIQYNAAPSIKNVTSSVTAASMSISANFPPGASVDANVLIHTKSVTSVDVSVGRKLFLSARQLCCCPITFARANSWITYEQDLTAYHFRKATPGFMSRKAFEQSRTMALAVRRAMLSK